jgi:hypothetical protein
MEEQRCALVYAVPCLPRWHRYTLMAPGLKSDDATIDLLAQSQPCNSPAGLNQYIVTSSTPVLHGLACDHSFNVSASTPAQAGAAGTCRGDGLGSQATPSHARQRLPLLLQQVLEVQASPL